MTVRGKRSPDSRSPPAGRSRASGISRGSPSAPRPGRRRTVALTLAAALTVAGGVALWGWLGQWRWSRGGPSTGAAAGYNVLLVTLDTVRADRLGCYGYTAARTPHLDRLAATGVRFAQAITPAPITMPSHATMLTGLLPPEHGVRDNGFRLAPERTTLPEVLSAQGYATAAFVSAFIVDRRFGLAQGFSTYDDDCSPPEAKTGAGAQGTYTERPAAAVTDAALGWLRSAIASRQPFFAWIHYFDAHHPYAPPAEYAGQCPSAYDGEIAYVDAQLGRVFKLLRDSGAEQRTLVILAGDHGEGLEDHGEPTHAYLIYDSTMRVPLILNSPALLGPARVIDDRVVSLADIMPTTLDLLGIRVPEALAGKNLLAAPSNPDRAIYIETLATRLNNGWAALHGLRRLHDKYVLAPQPEYFDLRTDPGELNNLAPANPAEMAALDEQLANLLSGWESVDQVVSQAAALSPEEARRLASLGYVGSVQSGTPVGVLDPKDMLPLWKRVMAAEIKSQQGQHAEAVAEIEHVVQRDPTDGHAWYYASYIYKRCNRMEDAERALRCALSLSPTASGYVQLAQLLLLRRQLGPEFEQVLAQAERLEPENGGIHLARGDRFLLQGRLKEALAAFERALLLDPLNAGSAARSKIELLKKTP